MLLFVEYVRDLKEILSAIRGDMRLQGGHHVSFKLRRGGHLTSKCPGRERGL